MTSKKLARTESLTCLQIWMRRSLKIMRWMEATRRRRPTSYKVEKVLRLALLLPRPRWSGGCLSAAAVGRMMRRS